MKQNAEILPTATVLKSMQLWPESEPLLELTGFCWFVSTVAHKKMKF